MALNASGMASKIINDLSGIDTPEAAINTFYSSLCSYCEENMEVWYTWVATTPPPTSAPDPMTQIQCKVITTGGISPSGATTPEAALGSFASDLNAQISLWQVQWPSGFALPPAFILPSIVFTASKATDQKSAWEHICQEIIDGITKAATPGPIPGAHGGYNIPAPGATYMQTL